MGYACPVCATPQADDEHLANHLAFTALLGDDDHESWLDEHVPGWEEVGPDELAPEVVGLADETEYDEVFEDTTGPQSGSNTVPDGHEDHEHDHGEESFEDRMARELGGDGSDGADEHGHDHRHGHGHDHRRAPQSDAIDVSGADSLDDEAQDILQEAHELTEEMYGGDTDASDDTAAAGEDESE